MLLSCLLLLSGLRPVTPLMSPPYIRTYDNLQEPAGSHFGIDLQGHGNTTLFTDMQAHSVKNGSSWDMNFYLDHGHIHGIDGAAGRCVAARRAEAGSPVDCPPCDTTNTDTRQR